MERSAGSGRAVTRAFHRLPSPQERGVRAARRLAPRQRFQTLGCEKLSLRRFGTRPTAASTKASSIQVLCTPASKAIASPGAFSTFSNCCGAIFRRARVAGGSGRAATTAAETPGLKTQPSAAPERVRLARPLGRRAPPPPQGSPTAPRRARPRGPAAAGATASDGSGHSGLPSTWVVKEHIKNKQRSVNRLFFEWQARRQFPSRFQVDVGRNGTRQTEGGAVTEGHARHEVLVGARSFAAARTNGIATRREEAGKSLARTSDVTWGVTQCASILSCSLPQHPGLSCVSWHIASAQSPDKAPTATGGRTPRRFEGRQRGGPVSASLFVCFFAAEQMSTTSMGKDSRAR